MAITYRDLADRANRRADEGIDDTSLLDFCQAAMSSVNIDCMTTYPMPQSLNENCPLPENWAQAIFVPHITSQIKMVDSSQFEYDAQMGMAMDAIEKFNSSYNVPSEFWDMDARGWDPVMDEETGLQAVDENGNKLWQQRTSDIMQVPAWPWGTQW